VTVTVGWLAAGGIGRVQPDPLAAAFWSSKTIATSARNVSIPWRANVAVNTPAKAT